MTYSLRSLLLFATSTALLVSTFFFALPETTKATQCNGGRLWRYRDADQDKLGNPSKSLRICRIFPREGYVRNRRDENDQIAQFQYHGLKRGWVKIVLRDNSYYRFRSFQTPRATKKNVKVVRFYKNGRIRNRLIGLHPRGKFIKFINYATGFTEHTERISSERWDRRYMTLHDFNLDGGPEVVVLLKTDSTVEVHVVRYVTKSGFTREASLEITDAENVILKNVAIDGTTITLRDVEESPVLDVHFDTESFTLTEGVRATQ